MDYLVATSQDHCQQRAATLNRMIAVCMGTNGSVNCTRLSGEGFALAIVDKSKCYTQVRALNKFRSALNNTAMAEFYGPLSVALNGKPTTPHTFVRFHTTRGDSVIRRAQ